MKFLSKVMKSQVDRIKKLTNKGVDPNFIDPETGGSFTEIPSSIQISHAVLGICRSPFGQR
jgi:hypothetical protein